MICKEKKFPSLKEAHTYVSDDTQLSKDLVLKRCLLILVEKACTFKILAVSFLNQGHLFLSGKSEMFLKARLSIKNLLVAVETTYHTVLHSVFSSVIFSI